MAKKKPTKAERRAWVMKWLHAHVDVTEDQIERVADVYQKRFKLNPAQAAHEVKQMDLWASMVHRCPNCDIEAQGREDINALFGLRKMRKRGKTYWQSWCKVCKNLPGEGNGNVEINPVLPEGGP